MEMQKEKNLLLVKKNSASRNNGRGEVLYTYILIYVIHRESRHDTSPSSYKKRTLLTTRAGPPCAFSKFCCTYFFITTFFCAFYRSCGELDAPEPDEVGNNVCARKCFYLHENIRV